MVVSEPRHMKITLFGTGYVGLVSGACFAELGNEVLCMDIDEQKISRLQKGEIPIFEPELDQLITRNYSSGQINFTCDPELAVSHGDLIFIAVGTPPGGDGSADLSAVYAVAKTIGQYMQDYKLVLNKSTVPVGSADNVRDIINEQLKSRNVNIEFDIASNPEFLREGAAIKDFMNPDRIIVGADTPRATECLRRLYTPLIDAGRRFIVMDTRSAELTKYASNAFLATKISFMNEMSHIAERVGADIEQVRIGMSMDPRIGEHFLYAGCGYGGSCFPKDVQALQKTASDYGYDAQILESVESMNLKQKQLMFEKINRYFSRDLKDKVIALWGLSFKPNTDDMRDASSLVLVDALLEKGGRIQAYDPIAHKNTAEIYDQEANITLCDSHQQTLENADVLVIITEWDEFKQADLAFVKEKLRFPAIFDGRNIYDPNYVASLGLNYYAIGRGLPI